MKSLKSTLSRSNSSTSNRSINEAKTLDTNLKPTSTKELRRIILRRIRKNGYNCDLNDIDVSGVTDMTKLFKGVDFNGDISR